MGKSKETSLQVISNTGILKKIVSFIIKIFHIKNIGFSNNDNKALNDKNSFLKSIKFQEDPDKAMLLKLQDDLEKNGINAENAYNLTKDLSETQKRKLLDLYKEQIKMYEASIKNHKNKILAIKKSSISII